MENHPIPQDVTGFQFRLIGTLTLKQFAYLATAGIFAVIFFHLPIHFLIKIPLILLSAGTGLGLAFVPVEGRPMDTMITHFLRDLTEPNQYLYQKLGNKLPISVVTIHHAPVLLPHQNTPVSPSQKKAQTKEKEKKLKAFLGSLHSQIQNKLDEKEVSYLESLFSPKTAGASTPQIITMDLVHKEKKQFAPLEKPKQKPTTPQEKEEALVKEAMMLKQQLDQARTIEAGQKTPQQAQAAHQTVLSLEQQLQEIVTEKQRLEQELITLRKQLVMQNQKTVAPTIAQAQKQSTLVHAIPKTMAKSVGFPNIPDVPNILVGIVKDPRGNILPNMLVEVKDKEGNPVRAFKTNLLGQFGSAMPLNNGTYLIELEDPKKEHHFEVIELTVTGEIILPLEIISQDAREQLRKELFN